MTSRGAGDGPVATASRLAKVNWSWPQPVSRTSRSARSCPWPSAPPARSRRRAGCPRRACGWPGHRWGRAPAGCSNWCVASFHGAARLAHFQGEGLRVGRADQGQLKFGALDRHAGGHESPPVERQQRALVAAAALSHQQLPAGAISDGRHALVDVGVRCWRSACHRRPSSGRAE